MPLLLISICALQARAFVRSETTLAALFGGSHKARRDGGGALEQMIRPNDLRRESPNVARRLDQADSSGTGKDGAEQQLSARRPSPAAFYNGGRLKISLEGAYKGSLRDRSRLAACQATKSSRLLFTRANRWPNGFDNKREVAPLRH